MKLSFTEPFTERPHLSARSVLSQLTLLVLFSLFSGCSGIQGKSKAERQGYVNHMRSETLKMLYDYKPSASAQLSEAVGYAVFSNINSNLLLLSTGSGYGVVHDNESGEDTYMRMASAGIGIGLGIKDFRGIIVFDNRKALDSFIQNGWDFTGQADAAAKSGDKGGQLLSGTVNTDLGITVYQFTENGLVAQATLQGTKYWVDKNLN
ncbi:YSC84-related protein [Endozoicomonas gorgoniicola]|uniref:YSC84-related protein n=1 Tax=Endozoicomonas gorgoniicola TaxID=1234144 RepID=A0ABT3N081_9GAMM|nr:YSC84-related protein [Endozoicomonas gorgoniicola]MCW7555032.1 YSC84-related protein [Endozoicomonas gorgoniicola]